MPRPARLLRLGPLPPNQFHPPKGQKPIYLPNFVLTLLRTPHSPPNWASFLTPLWLNKLDIKDYLYHGYGLKVLSVRSYVIQKKVQMDKSGAKRPVANRWFRPRSIKKMTVELAQEGKGQGPFVWPDNPEDLSPWSKEAFDKATEVQKEEQERTGDDAATVPKPDRKDLASQAKAILEGKVKWRPGWMDYGMGPRRGAMGRGLEVVAAGR